MLQQEIVIDLATREDIPAICDMLHALGAALNRTDGVKSTREHIAQFGFAEPPAFEAMIARRAGMPVGLAIYFFEFSTWRGMRGVYLQDLYVAEEMRGSGVGQRLLSAVAKRARSREARYMRLSIHAGNSGGSRFYERLGFVSQNEHVLVAEGEFYDALGTR